MGETVRPTTLFIDLDGVLRLWPSEYSALERDHNLPFGAIGRAAFEPDLLAQVVTGRITDREWRSQVASRLSAAYPSSQAVEGVAAWSAPAGTVHREVLRMVVLARKRCKVGLVTNATDRLPQDLKALGLCEHLDFVINSSEVGFAKPSPEIFKRALAVAGARPFEAVFIDDTASNISAAAALGIQAHHFASVSGLTAFMQAVGLVTDAA